MESKWEKAIQEADKKAVLLINVKKEREKEERIQRKWINHLLAIEKKVIAEIEKTELVANCDRKQL